MSAIASFLKLPESALPDLRKAAAGGSFHGFLHQHGRSVADYKFSGYVLDILLVYLEEEHQINLMKSEHDELASFLSKTRGATYFIFTHAQKQAFGSKLSGQFSEKELLDYYNEFNEAEETEAGKAMLDGIVEIVRSLEALDEESVILFSIG